MEDKKRSTRNYTELTNGLIEVYDNYQNTIMLLQNEIYLLAHCYYDSNLLERKIIHEILFERICELNDASEKFIKLFDLIL